MLLAESKLPYIKDRRQFLCCNYLAKILSNKNRLIFKSVPQFFKNKKNKKFKRKRLYKKCIEILMNPKLQIHETAHYNIYSNNNDFITTSIPLDKTRPNIRKYKNPNQAVHSILDKENSLLIFTDGSTNPTTLTAGSACVCPKLNITKTRKLNPKTSFFSAECIAILGVLNIALNTTSKYNCILSDSLSVVQFLQEKTESVNIQLYWIHSHCGIQGNETTDLAAKTASTSSTVEFNNIIFIDLSESFRNTMFENSCETITRLGPAKGSKYFNHFYIKKS